MTTHISNARVLKNTLVLYIRQIFLTLINLYSLRVVLNMLGVDGYGIYTVVSGIVALASFLPGSMSSATQRYFSFALGRNDQAAITRIFSINLIIYIGVCVLALALLESVGLWFVQVSLNIPSDKVDVAKLLYQISIFTFVSSLLASPFIAIIIAHEDMDIYAYVSLYEAIAKLIAAITIAYAPWEKLSSYGAALLIVSMTTTLLYIILSRKRYQACIFVRDSLDLATFKEILSFTSWTLFGQLTNVARNQAITILLNQMFNPTVAAARAIATSVASQVAVFSGNFNTSLYPPIIKHYSANQKEEMFSVLIWGSKLTFFLMWVFALPLYLEMETVLRLWLVTPPAEAIYFSQLALVEALIMAISLPLATAARAPGKMRLYELTLGSIQMTILLASWILLSLGYPAESVFFAAIAANVLMFFTRILLIKMLVNFSISNYIIQSVLPASYVAICSGFVSIIFDVSMPPGLLGSAATIIFSLMAAIIFMYIFGMDKKQKKMIVSKVFGYEKAGR